MLVNTSNGALLVATLALSSLVGQSHARSWTDAINNNKLTSTDTGGKSKTTNERNPFRFTESPTMMPTGAPTAPTASPTPAPTGAPTPSPTSAPTGRPTNEWHAPEPEDPDRGYFSYDPQSEYGPDKWEDMSDKTMEETTEHKYWDSFDKWIKPSIKKNSCDGDKQSPINVNMADIRGECLQYHEFRHKTGDYKLGEDPEIKVKILPSKLRLEYPDDIGEYTSWTPSFCKGGMCNPAADVPKAWGDGLPMIHADFKVPSEHWIDGKQYSAEYQIWQIQNRSDRKRGAPAMAILIDAEADEHNEHIQQALDAFQEVFDRDMAECQDKRRRELREDAKAENMFNLRKRTDASTILDEPKEIEEEFQARRDNLRKLQEKRPRRWDPWHPDLYRTVWFYGYYGSLTEPPCTEFVEWHISDVAAEMSKAQLRQMQTLLFKHVDEDCNLTTNGHNGSVARPIQPITKDHDLYRCSCDNFLSDYMVIQQGRKNCGMTPGQKDNVAKQMRKQSGKDDKPWTVKDEDWPGNSSDLKDYCGGCNKDQKDDKYQEELQEEAIAKAKKEAEKAREAAEEAAKAAAKAAEKAAKKAAKEAAEAAAAAAGNN